MKLTVLGSQGTWPGAGRECCGYVVTSGGFHLWMDAGTGTFARLQQHFPVGEVGAMLISHGHADHFLDMIPAFYALHYGAQGEPGLPFYSPEGFTDLASLLVSENGRNVMGEAYAFTLAEHGRVFEVGPFRVTPYEMTHIGVRALGYRIEADGVTLAYSWPFAHVREKPDRPWLHLQRAMQRLAVEECLWGTGYLAHGVKEA